MKEREKMKRNKLITLGALLTSSLIETLPLASSASSTKEDTIAPLFKSLSGEVYYSFTSVIANRIALMLIDGINGGTENPYYLSVTHHEMLVSPATYIEYFVWKANNKC